MVDVILIEKYNKRHAPKGSPMGGQFISGHTALALGMEVSDKPKGPYIRPYTALFSQAIARVYGPKQPININMKPGAEGHLADNGITSFEVLAAMSEALRTVRADQLNGITKIDIVDIKEAGIAGSYTYGSGVLQLDPAESTLNEAEQQNFSLQHEFLHEIGHNAFANISGDQRVRYAELVGYPNPEDLRDISWFGKSNLTPEQIIIFERMKKVAVKAPSTYGQSNILESWAESFTYINWQTKKLMWNTVGMPEDILAILQEISAW